MALPRFGPLKVHSPFRRTRSARFTGMTASSGRRGVVVPAPRYPVSSLPARTMDGVGRSSGTLIFAKAHWYSICRRQNTRASLLMLMILTGFLPSLQTTRPNNADAPNPAMTSLFQSGRHECRVGNLRRYVASIFRNHLSCRTLPIRPTGHRTVTHSKRSNPVCQQLSAL